MKTLIRAIAVSLALVLASTPALAQYVELWRITSSDSPAAEGFDLGDTDGSYPTTQEGSQGSWPGSLAHSNQALAMPGFAGIHTTPPNPTFLATTVYGNTDSDTDVEFVSFMKSLVFCGASPGALMVWDGATGTTAGPAIPVIGVTPCAVVRYILLLDVNASDGLGRAEILIHWTDISTDPDTYGTICYGYTGLTGSAPQTPSGTQLLRQNVPNPFAGTTQIQYSLGSSGPVDLRIYDVQGRLVRTLTEGKQPAGPHAVVWDGRDGEGSIVATGTYFYELVTEGGNQTRKAIRLE